MDTVPDACDEILRLWHKAYIIVGLTCATEEA